LQKEVEVVKISCRCGHYVLYEAGFEPSLEGRTCPRCDHKKNHVGVRQWNVCAGCGLTKLDDGKCYCLPKEQKFTIITDPNKAWTKNTPSTKIQDEIYMGKTSSMITKKVRKAKEEPLRVAKENNELLKQLVTIMSPKKEKIITKEENHSAVL